MADGKKILVVSLGRTPQVVTETLWGLLQRPEPFVPDEIHLLTTSLGEGAIRTGWDGIFLCDPDDSGAIAGARGGRLAELCRSFDITPPRIFIHTPQPPPLDLRNEDASLAYADLCVRVLAILRREDPEPRLHVSIAGGRKIMSFYMGYALSLLGRPEDELTHVLVSPPEFEGRDFWWPGGPPGVIETAGARLATDRAEVELVPVPFLALREHVDEALLMRLVEGSVGFSELVQWMSGRIVPELVLCRSRPRITYGGRTLELQPLQAAMLHVLARALRENWPGFGPEGVGGSGWLSWQEFEDGGRPLQAFQEAYEKLAPGRSPGFLDDVKTVLHGAPRNFDFEAFRGRLQQLRAKLGRALREFGHTGPAALRIEHRRCRIAIPGKTDPQWREIFGLVGVAPVRIRFED